MKTFFAASAAATLVLFGSAASADTVKVGIIAPLSGPFSQIGETWTAGIKAYQKIHGTTVAGHTIEFVYRDLPDVNPAQAKALAQELIIKEGVQYIGGMYFTPDALAVGAIADEAKLPLVIFNAATSSILDKSQFALRTSYTLPQVSVPVAKYMLEQGVKTVVTLVSDYGPGLDSESSFSKTFTEGGGKVLDKIRAPLKTTDFGPFMQSIKGLSPGALFVFAPGGPPTFALIKAYNQSGLKEAGVRAFGTGETSERDLPALGAGAEGFITGLFYSPVHPSPLNDKFIKTLAEVAPKEIPAANHVNAYDGMHLIYHMIEATGGKRDGAKAIASAKGFAWESPRGPVKVDANSRELVQNVYMRRVEKDANGKYVNREFRTYDMQPDYGRILK